MDDVPVLKTEHLMKHFGPLTATNDVSIEVGQKEIHALIGENGAGKSTICKMLTGMYRPDSGNIYLCGRKLEAKTVFETMEAGISMVYQERNLVDYLNAAQNIVLGSEPSRCGLLSEKTAMKKAVELRDRLKINIPLDVAVGELGAGTQQLIEIMKALSTNPKLLILDEPTASLGMAEIGPFLEFVRHMKEDMDVSVIFISHKIEEVFDIADKVTVLTDGRVTLSKHVKDTTPDECISAMIRNSQLKPIEIKEKPHRNSVSVLKVDKLKFDGKDRRVSFHVDNEEVVGFYGLVGSGRTETMEVIFGTREADEREFVFDGQKITRQSTRELIDRGMIFTTELRKNSIFESLSLIDNISSLFLDKLSGRTGIVNFNRCRAFAEKVLKENAVKYTDTGQNISELSGGNIQKTIIGRSLAVENLKLAIFDEPTNGIDLGAKNEIYHKIRHLVDCEKKAAVFISSELDELLAVCDRIYVFYEGEISKEFARNHFDKQKILDEAVRGGGIKNAETCTG